MLSGIAEGIYRCLHAFGRVARFSSVEQTQKSIYRCCTGPNHSHPFLFLFVRGAKGQFNCLRLGWFRVGAHEVIPRAAVVPIGVPLCASRSETQAIPTSRSMVESRSKLISADRITDTYNICYCPCYHTPVVRLLQVTSCYSHIDCLHRYTKYTICSARATEFILEASRLPTITETLLVPFSQLMCGCRTASNLHIRSQLFRPRNGERPRRLSSVDPHARVAPLVVARRSAGLSGTSVATLVLVHCSSRSDLTLGRILLDVDGGLFETCHRICTIFCKLSSS